MHKLWLRLCPAWLELGFKKEAQTILNCIKYQLIHTQATAARSYQKQGEAIPAIKDHNYDMEVVLKHNRLQPFITRYYKGIYNKVVYGLERERESERGSDCVA